MFVRINRIIEAPDGPVLQRERALEKASLLAGNPVATSAVNGRQVAAKPACPHFPQAAGLAADARAKSQS